MGEGCWDYWRSPWSEPSVQQWLRQAQLNSLPDPLRQDERQSQRD